MRQINGKYAGFKEYQVIKNYFPDLLFNLLVIKRT
jgi:hypothetical protein